MRVGMLLGQTGVLAVAAVVDQASGHPNFSSYLRGPGSRIRCFRLKKKYTEKILRTSVPDTGHFGTDPDPGSESCSFHQ
jgi:hypothetical protein